jgi:hypothetical protein
MNNLSTPMIIAIMVVTFIAGYAVVSFAVRKFKEGAREGKPHPMPIDDEDEKRPGPTSEDRWR